MDAEEVEGEAGADDVGDGIGRADFVEMDLLDGDLVDFGFGLGELLEYGEGVGLGALREVSLLDDLDDVREVAVGVLMLDGDVEFGGADAAAFDFLEGDGGADFERGDGVR